MHTLVLHITFVWFMWKIYLFLDLSGNPFKVRCKSNFMCRWTYRTILYNIKRNFRAYYYPNCKINPQNTKLVEPILIMVSSWHFILLVYLHSFADMLVAQKSWMNVLLHATWLTGLVHLHLVRLCIFSSQLYYYDDLVWSLCSTIQVFIFISAFSPPLKITELCWLN